MIPEVHHHAVRNVLNDLNKPWIPHRQFAFWFLPAGQAGFGARGFPAVEYSLPEHCHDLGDAVDRPNADTVALWCGGPGEPEPVGAIFAWVWIDGEMREAMPPLAISDDERARQWAEIDLPLLTGRETDGA